MAPAVAHSWSGEDVRVADVARRLRELRGDEGRPTTLTSVMNLVACAPGAREARDVEAVTDALTDHHPSRAVIVVPGECGDRIDARVEVMSRQERPGGRTLDVEQIILTLHGAVAAHAASAVVPLLRSELPTFLWWPGAPDPDSPTFGDLARIADRLVTETGRGLRGRAALERLAAAAASSPAPLTDLAWAVLTAWRQIVAMALRGAALLELRAGAATATITTPPGEPALEALLVAGWLVEVLGRHVRVRFVEASGEEDILGIELTGDRGCVMELTRDEGSTATVTLKTAVGGPRSLPLPHPGRTELLAGELELRGHDVQMERALVHACALPAR